VAKPLHDFNPLDRPDPPTPYARVNACGNNLDCALFELERVYELAPSYKICVGGLFEEPRELLFPSPAVLGDFDQSGLKIGRDRVECARVIGERHAHPVRILQRALGDFLAVRCKEDEGQAGHIVLPLLPLTARAIIPDEDLHRHAAENIARADAVLFGRVTYEMMKAAWKLPMQVVMPAWTEPFARTIDAAKKYVVSSALDQVDWNTELVRGDLSEAVQRLKREPGKGLFTGGVKLPMALAELGLIDEYEIVVHPRLAGHGPTLFAGLSKFVDLKLVSRQEFGSGRSTPTAPRPHASVYVREHTGQHIVVGVHPCWPRVVVVGGFSGHGYKMASVIGEVAADLVEHGQSRRDIALFDPTR
jgi:dihydrofolate reductase